MTPCFHANIEDGGTCRNCGAYYDREGRIVVPAREITAAAQQDAANEAKELLNEGSSSDPTDVFST
jgi:hypothetical protein